LRWFEFLSGLALGGIIVWAWLQRRRWLRDRIHGPGLDDDAVDRIIREGHLEVEMPEPLDLDEIARAESEFWDSEGWDPAEEDRLP
jgi:hypothetical protein